MPGNLLDNNKGKNSRPAFLNDFGKGRAAVVIVLLIIGLLIYNNYRSRNSVAVELAVAEKQELTDSFNASGEVSAEQRSDINFLTSGEVSQLNVKEGSMIEKGDIIARLNTTNLYQAYLQAEANLRKAEATLDRVYDDVQDSEDDESFSEREARTTAEAAKDVAYRSFVQASENLSNATLRAPASGLVAFVSEGLAPGFYATPATAEIIIVDPSTAIFEADVNEVSISNIYLGQRALITLDAYDGEEFEGEVTHIGVTAVTTSTGGTAYPVEVSFPGKIGLKFKLGMNGDAEFVLEKKEDVVVIPITAVVEEDEGEFVWISDNGIARKVKVETGLSSINDIEITKGINEGQTVVVRPPSDIDEGKRILVEKEE